MTNPKYNMCSIGCHRKNVVVAKAVGIEPPTPEPKPKLGITARCEKCRFIGNLDEFKLDIDNGVDVEEDFSMPYVNVSLSCPKCGNTVELRE